MSVTAEINTQNKSSNSEVNSILSDTAKCHDSFEWLQSERIESLDIIISHFKHKKTGAHHYHIAADNDENVFLVALRTIPTD